jgi:L-asparaginase
MQSVVIIGTGGTIAGTAARPQDHVGYTAGALDVADLIAAVPALQGQSLEAETLAQLDSCDMDHLTWAALARRAAWHLARPEVAGVVVTHGTDTLEETAYFLHRTLAAAKPLVLTAAMRPATALSADGPQNLLDAVTVAREPGAHGVLAVLGARVMAGRDLRKVHGYRVDAFDTGDAGPVAVLEDGIVRHFRAWPDPQAHTADVLGSDPASWPVVDVVTSHAGARAAVIDALVAAGAQGLVIAGTGNGSVHTALCEAAGRAQTAGVRVWRASRCQRGGVVGAPVGTLPSAGPLTAVQARIELLLDLLAERQAREAEGGFSGGAATDPASAAHRASAPSCRAPERR